MSRPLRQTRLQALLNRPSGRPDPKRLEAIDQQILQNTGWTRAQLQAYLDERVKPLQAMADVLYPHLPRTLAAAEREAAENRPPEA